jgi:hypothetical protein
LIDRFHALPIRYIEIVDDGDDEYSSTAINHRDCFGLTGIYESKELAAGFNRYRVLGSHSEIDQLVCNDKTSRSKVSGRGSSLPRLEDVSRWFRIEKTLNRRGRL